MIPAEATKSNMFKSFNKNSFYNDPIYGKERGTIFGNDIPQVAKAKPDPNSSACCIGPGNQRGKMPAGGFKMNAFYSTIWSRNLRNVLSSNMAFGEKCCNDK